MFFNIYIYSKNYNSLNNFVAFLNNKLHNFCFIKSPKKTSKTILTFLKSPHVNKTAQEHFSFNYFTKNLLIKPKNPLLILFIIKLIKKNLFLDVKFKIKVLNHKRLGTGMLKNFTHPADFNLYNSKSYLTNYLNVLNNYGKTVVSKKFSLDSSVG